MAADTATGRAAPRPSLPRLSTPRPSPRTAPWILMYHSVGDPADDPYGITVARDRLDRQLAWLRRRRFTAVGVGALLRGHAAGRRGLVGLTFDDGYADFLHEALPVLHRHSCTATVFVLPGLPGGVNAWDPLGPRKPLLTEDDIRAVARAGMEIGSHGMHHLDLTGLPDPALRHEVRTSRLLIHDITGTAPEGFCYPYGTVDHRVRDAVSDAGYAYGCAIGPGPLTGGFALPRTHISQADRDVRLHAKRLRHRLRSRTEPGHLAPRLLHPALQGERR